MQHPQRGQPQRCTPIHRRRTTLLLGLVPIALLAAVLLKQQHDAPPAAGAPQAQHAPATNPGAHGKAPAAPAATPVRLADFRGEAASPDARLVANWVVATGDHDEHAFILVDKKDAHAYVFTPEGRLQESAPVLLGAAVGDEVLPGSGDKPFAQIRPEEKTTPAGRFVAEAGTNDDDEDVIWVDYDNAISLHRVRPWVASEHRLERLASADIGDNRVSFGCINLPVSFYEDVARPAVTGPGAIVYVLPEVKTPQQVFGAYDVTDPRQFAAARPPALATDAGTAQPTSQG